MIEIDGSQGEGGGQIIRSSLALAAVTGTPVTLTKIRAGRKKSGLMRQHLAAVKAAGEVCDAKITGAELGAKEISFAPQSIHGGDFHIKVGTAGSTTLIAQTILPTLMLADQPSTVTLEGGTHNPWAPPFDFLQRSFLPQLSKAGPEVSAEIDAHGFYPAGGGKFRLQISPQPKLAGFDLLDQGSKPEPRVTAIVAGLNRSVGQRECDVIRRKTGWSDKCFHVHEVPEPQGIGNVVLIELLFANVTEMFIGIGEKGKTAEHVARDVLRQAKAYLASDVPVGKYLADQLMMPMGLAANQGQSSKFRTGPLSMHSKTHIDVLKKFLKIKVDVQTETKNEVIVAFTPDGEDRSLEV